MTTTATTFTSSGKSIAAEIFWPDRAGGGTVIIAYGSDGLVDNAHGPWATMIREYAADLAADGFTAIVPDYFQRTGTSAGQIDFLKDGAQQIWLHRDDWQSTLEDALDYALTLPGADPSRTGLLGFSLGGHLCLRVRAKVKVLVEFFAPLLDGMGAAGPRPYAQIHHGVADQLVRFEENAAKIEQYLRATGASTELFRYEGAGHGFAGSGEADTNARKLSKSRTRAFFKTHL
jgi:carboxymethylenebutenolidase